MDGLEVIDQPTDDLVFDDQSIDDAPAEPVAGNEPQAKTPDEPSDWRRVPKEWSAGIKELRELYPDRADMLTKLRDGYSRYAALSEFAPKGLEDVKQWKTTIDAVGGPEAAAELMQRAASMDHIDSQIEAGNFGVISELPENLQAGFYKMLPDALTDLRQRDEKAYEAAVMPHFAAALAGTGMEEHLKEMYAKADGNAELQGLIKQQYDWYQRQVRGSGAMPSGSKAVDPQVQRLQAELDTRRRGDDEAFVSGITDTTRKYVEESFAKNAEVYLKQFNLTEAQKSDLMDSYGAKLTDKLGSDAAFSKQLQAYKAMKNRSADQVNSYIRSKVDESAKSIIDGLVTARYGGMRRKPAALTSGTTTTDGGATRVAQIPDQSQWDMQKMEGLGYEATAKAGVYHLKGGRTVQVVKQ